MSKFNVALILLILILSNLQLNAEGKIIKHPEREDIVGFSKDDVEMNKAIEKARNNLKEFEDELKNLSPFKRYLLKIKISENEDVEYVWLEPVFYVDGLMIGYLSSKPSKVQKYKKGDVFKPSPKEIIDWVVQNKDGTKKGGSTVDVIQKRMKKKKAAEENK